MLRCSRRLIIATRALDSMILDCHVHVCAITPGHGSMSPRVLRSLPFRFMRWRLGMRGEDEATERQVEAKLVETIHTCDDIDAAVILAFDAVYDPQGNLDAANTHLYVTNDYALELSRRHPKMLFGASVHP